MKTLQKKPHKYGCFAVEEVRRGFWKSPWAYPELFFANKFGNETKTGRGTKSWVKVKCNDPSCPAYLLVDNDELMATLPHGF